MNADIIVRINEVKNNAIRNSDNSNEKLPLSKRHRKPEANASGAPIRIIILRIF
jgi:hypothetical protein